MNPVQNLTPATPDKIRQHLLATIRSVLEKSACGLEVCEQVLECRQLLESLPLSTGEFGLAIHRLRNAHRYLASDERGAAHYELQLLAGSLCNGDTKTVDCSLGKQDSG